MLKARCKPKGKEKEASHSGRRPESQLLHQTGEMKLTKTKPFKERRGEISSLESLHLKQKCKAQPLKLGEGGVAGSGCEGSCPEVTRC
mmetsp:Transcript_69343/g.162323  ORF Transcript_69343/g.162323 Transcript_69343/m.162323 type:complete len:88 (+) Transcript_69343:888-1151(+)